MNSNYYKLFMKLTGTKYGKNLLLKGIPFIYGVLAMQNNGYR